MFDSNVLVSKKDKKMGKKDLRAICRNGQLPDPKGINCLNLVEDIWPTYRETTKSLLSELGVAARALETGCKIEENSSIVQRVLHSIKGNSGVVGLTEVHDICHRAESAFKEMTDISASVDMLLEVKGWIEAVIKYISENNISTGKQWWLNRIFRCSFTPKKYILFFMFSMIIFASMGWYAWSSSKQLAKFEYKRDEIIGLRGAILHFDEVLTMSARMAAATGDVKWERRYRIFEPQLDDAIKKAKKLAPKDFMSQAAGKTDTANIKFVALENKSFDLVRQGNLQAADKLLYSQDYEEQKSLYKEGMDQYITTLQKYMENERNRYYNAISVLFVCLVTMFLVTVFSGITILQMRKNLVERKNPAKFPSEDPNPVLRISKDGEVLYSNEPGKLLLTKWEIDIGKIVPERLHNLIAQAIAFEKIAAAEEEVEDEVFSLIITPVKGTDYANVHALNITERKQVERQLRKSENQYRVLVENLPQRILLKDKNSVFISCNESYAQEFGVTPAEIIGKTDYDFYEKLSADRYRESDREVMKSGAKKDDYITLMEDDEERIVHVTKTPVVDDKNELIGVLCIFEDVTKQKKVERLARHAYEELHQAHEELKSVQSQIIQNEKLAAIGQLAAGVAHEINNPLGFVSSNFETLQNYIKKFLILFDAYSGFVVEAKSEGIKKLLDRVEMIEKLREDIQIDFVIEDIDNMFLDMQEGVSRITTIVQNLRDFSRIDQHDEVAEYDLNNGIKSTLIVARNEIKYYANVKNDFGKIPLIFCNSGQVNQVFLNILINAVHAIKSQQQQQQQKKKKGIIKIKTYTDGKDAVCEISDNGPGIPPDKMSKIFDPFFTTKPPGKGTGLGLSVSHDIIVNKHKGMLFVDSVIDKGTTFTIRLPIKCEVTEEGQTSEELSEVI